MVSNGEYMPLPQSQNQKRVEARVNELADEASRKLGVSRRHFLTSTGGMAASFLAMNEVFGDFFDINVRGLLIPEAYAQAGPPTRPLRVRRPAAHGARQSLQRRRAAARAGAGAELPRRSSRIPPTRTA